MANSTHTFIVRHSRGSDYQGKESMNARTVMSRVSSFMSGCASGAYEAEELEVGMAAAGGAYIFDGAADLITMYIAGVELPQFDADTTDEQAAIDAAAIINDPSNGLSVAVTAVAENNLCIITCNYPGRLGNFIQLAINGTGASASDTTLTQGTSTVYTF